MCQRPFKCRLKPTRIWTFLCRRDFQVSEQGVEREPHLDAIECTRGSQITITVDSRRDEEPARVLSVCVTCSPQEVNIHLWALTPLWVSIHLGALTPRR